MVRAMCGAKLMEKKRTEYLMEMLELKETAVQMAKAFLLMPPSIHKIIDYCMSSIDKRGNQSSRRKLSCQVEIN